MIGDIIRKLRISKDLTQEALAENAGISPTTLGNIETGRTRNPDKATIERIADALGVDVGVLLADSEVAMGRAVPGTTQVPVGYSMAALTVDEDETLRVLREALARVSTLEMTGKATKPELIMLRRLVARLEGHEVTNQE